MGSLLIVWILFFRLLATVEYVASVSASEASTGSSFLRPHLTAGFLSAAYHYLPFRRARFLHLVSLSLFL